MNTKDLNEAILIDMDMNEWRKITHMNNLRDFLFVHVAYFQILGIEGLVVIIAAI